MPGPDYAELANEIRKINEDLGTSKQVIQLFSDSGKSGKELTDALKAVDTLSAALKKKLEKTPVTDDERKRKVAELDSDIHALNVQLDAEPSFDKRKFLRLKIGSLEVLRGEFNAATVFNFDDLLNPDKVQLKEALEDAIIDLKAKQSLARVLAGVQAVMEVAGYSAGVAAKLAVTAAG